MSPLEIQFLVGLGLSAVLGFIIGLERESRGKDAGISTHILVIAGSMLFTMISAMVDPYSTSRIASNIIPGIGFLGAGLILKEGGNVHNLTTAASLWFSAAIGMAIGFGFYGVAAIAGIACTLIPRIPSLRKS
jgi:putative Mg2+ transporter-C (MgtC) family protein